MKLFNIQVNKKKQITGYALIVNNVIQTIIIDVVLWFLNLYIITHYLVYIFWFFDIKYTKQNLSIPEYYKCSTNVIAL